MARLRQPAPAEETAASAAAAAPFEAIYISSDEEITVQGSTNGASRVAGIGGNRCTNGPPTRTKTKRWTGWDASIIQTQRKARQSDVAKKSGRAQAKGKENEPPYVADPAPVKAPVAQVHITPQGTLSAKPQKAKSTGLTYWIRGDQGAYWSHTTYRNAQNAPVEVIYCKTRAESEKAARRFLDNLEPIVGFDMEWKSRGAKGIKGNISLIQVGCEDKIALFHIALHAGTSVSELLAPSLRKIIESPAIAKTGVAVYNADGQRLRRFMRVEPKGFFELSFLHRVVKYGHRKPDLVNKKLVKLTYLAADHLGKPLHKGPVRTSDWTKPLSQEQIDYAASDAYAGFRLYHAMEAKRLKMSPVPPRPAYVELRLPLKLIEDEQADAAEVNPSAASSNSRQPP